MNNVTIVEVINHNQVFNFNQIEQVLNHTDQQLPQTSSEPLVNSPRPSRSTNSVPEYSVASPRQSNRHQTHSSSVVDETNNEARSSNHVEINDRTTNGDEIPQRSASEVSNEGQRIKVRMNEPEDGRLRRRLKRHEVVLPVTDQETTSNYEHLVLPSTNVQSRPSPSVSNFIPTDMALLPTRPQVRFNY